MIKVKEECEQRENQMRAQVRQIQNEKNDLQFLANQKDFKIQELDKSIADMRSKLDKALTKSYNPNANDVVKGLRKEINQQDNIVGKKQEFILSRPLDSQNIDPNKGNLVDFQTQQQVWADELRNADQRALTYKRDLELLQQSQQDYEKKIKELFAQINTRDTEIQRLSMLYKGGQTFDTVKINYDKHSSSEEIQKLHKQNEFLNSENHRLESEMLEIKQLLGICESKDPTDVDRTHLKKLIRELKSRNDQMQKDIKQMNEELTRLRNGLPDQETMKLQTLNQKEVQSLQEQLEDCDRQITELQRENQKLKGDAEKLQQYQSAYMSNQKAFNENIESLSKEARDKEAKLQQISQEHSLLTQDLSRVKEELNMYKGKCATLTRDLEMSQQFMDQKQQNNQDAAVRYLKDLLTSTENQLEQAVIEKAESQSEAKRLQSNLDQLERTVQEMKLNNMKAQGDTQSNSAQINRLQTQLNSKVLESELLQRQKEELESIVSKLKSDQMESEQRAQDYYQQLLRSQENFTMIQNEQKLLSQEITMKQTEVNKLEKDRMALERELLQLRPLKTQLEKYSQSTQKQIEENVRNEYERNKLQSKVIELQNEVEVKKAELQDINLKYNNLIIQNTKLIEQLKIFEKESFEIQAKIRRGFELEKDQDSLAKTLDSLRTNEREHLRQLEDLRAQVKQKDLEIDRLKSRTDNTSYYTKTLEQELQDSRSEIQRLTDAINSHKNEAIIQEQRKNQSEVESLDLKRSLTTLREDKQRLEADFSQIKKEFEEEKARSKSIQQQCDRLRAMVENLDQTREQLVQRLQSTSQEKRGEEQDKAMLLQDIQTYKKELQQKDREIEELRKSIESMDNTVDDLQAELDQKTEELAQARIQLDKQSREFSNVQHQMSVTIGKEDNFQRRLFEREQEIKQLRIELQSLRQQLEEQSQLAIIKTQEAAELLEDIQTLTRENKYVSTEFGKSATANEFFRKQSEELTERERMAQQQLRALELEKADILANYRNACLDNERLQDSLQHLQDENKDLYTKLQALEKDLYGFQHKMRDYDQREQNYISEIHTLERHIDKLTHQLDQLHRQLKETNDERDAIINDMNQHRNLSYSMEMGREDLQRQMTQIESEKQYIKQQQRDLQRENDILRKQIEMEREKYNELERVLIQERKVLQQKDFQMQDLYREQEQDKSEIERQKLRIQSLQTHIDSLQKFSKAGGPGASSGRDSQSQLDSYTYTRVLELEDQLRQAQDGLIELDGLRRENGQLKEYLNQYENQIQDLENELQSLKN